MYCITAFRIKEFYTIKVFSTELICVFMKVDVDRDQYCFLKSIQAYIE